MDEPAVDATIPRACSDVFRLWTSVAVGALWSVAFVVALVILGSVAVQADVHAEFRIEIGLGLQLIAWNAFAVTYLVLGVRAFSGCDRDELVRRVHGSPLPRSALQRWLLAGGGGQAWAVVIAVGAFASMVRALVEESTTTPILAFAGVSVLLSLLVIAFSFALHYARHDIEQGGLAFAGPGPPVFSDYVYVAVGCSATFGTTDTQVTTSAMRRVVTLHSALGWLLNTVVVAALVSLIVA